MNAHQRRMLQANSVEVLENVIARLGIGEREGSIMASVATIEILRYNLVETFSVSPLLRKFLPPGTFYGFAVVISDEPGLKDRFLVLKAKKGQQQ